MKNKNEQENKTHFLPLFMSIGVSVGVAIGVATDNIAIGMSIKFDIMQVLIPHPHKSQVRCLP